MSKAFVTTSEIPAHVRAIIEHTLEHEGGVSDHKDDSGGLTKWGIASRYHPEVLDPGFTLDDAKRIYYTTYYLKPQLYKLPRDIQPALFDMSVNLGHPAATKLLQRRLDVTADGAIGQETLTAIAARDLPTLRHQLVEDRLLYYIARIIESPKKQVFARGWIRRSLSFLT